MIIGTYTFDKKANTYSGNIRTLLLDYAAVHFRPAETSSDSGPDFRIFITRPDGAEMECGAAWSRTSEKGKPYFSVLIDDPGMARPLSTALFPSEDGKTAALVWNRPKPGTQAAAPANTSTKAKAKKAA